MESAQRPTLNHMLTVKDRNGPKAYWLTAPMYSIGRDPSNSICIDSQYVSRTHALLVRLESEEDPGQAVYQIIDGDAEGNPSRNGLRLRGQRIESHNLRDGDEIQFGSDATATYAVQERNLDSILSTYEHTEVFLTGSNGS